MNWEDFNAVAYNYRSWPGSDPKGVVERYEELCKFVREAIEEAASNASESSSEWYERNYTDARP
jgi:hypothetical protein